MPAVKTSRRSTAAAKATGKAGAPVKAKGGSARPASKTAVKTAPRAATKAATKAAPRTARKSSAARPAPARPAAPRRNPRVPKPKGLEVSYSGHIFRSRLEARWAVLLDLLEIDYDYEVCFYRVGDGLTYLPDFYLPGQDLWLEVKGPAFLDAQSMAKCLASVAGPAPLPSRSAPYAPSGQLLLVGPFQRPSAARPVHTLLTREGPGLAALSYATFSATGATPVAGPWDTAVADGVKKSRRPAPARLKALLEPAPVELPFDEATREAYRFAATLAFDDARQCISAFNDGGMTARLERRRAGRPLGMAA